MRGTNCDWRTYVYAIVRPADGGGGHVKIGISRDPESRCNQLQTSCAETIYVHGYFPGSRQIEAEIHDSLAEYRERGEWFRIDGDVVEFLDAVATLHGLAGDAMPPILVDDGPGGTIDLSARVEQWFGAVITESLRELRDSQRLSSGDYYALLKALRVEAQQHEMTADEVLYGVHCAIKKQTPVASFIRGCGLRMGVYR